MKKSLLVATSLAFCVQVSAQLPNAGMEQWRPVAVSGHNFEVPVDWYSADSMIATDLVLSSVIPSPQKHISPTADAASGSTAAMVVSKNAGGVMGVLPGVLANAAVGFDLTKLMANPNNPSAGITFSGGTPVSQRVGGVKAMVKYETTGVDTGGMLVRAILNNASTGNTDSVVGEGFAIITPNSSYAQIYAPVAYINESVVPTAIVVAFASSALSVRVDGSTIYVDDVDFVSVSVSDVAPAETAVTVYPNPADNMVQIEAKEQGVFVWEAYNIQGQKVAENRFSGKAMADITHLPNGVYSYRVFNSNGAAVQQGKLSVLR